MAEPSVDRAAKAIHKEIATRAWDFRMQGVKEPLLAAFQEFDDRARALGYESASKLWGKVSTTHKGANGATATLTAVNNNGAAKASNASIPKPTSAKERYKTLITRKGTFVPADPTMSALLKVSPARISHIRSELNAEGYVFEKVENGFVASPPEPKPAPVEPDPPGAVVEAQLPLPAPVAEPVAIVTLENVTGRFVETDLSVAMKKIAHIESLLEQQLSEQRQLRGIMAQLLQKGS